MVDAKEARDKKDDETKFPLVRILNSKKGGSDEDNDDDDFIEPDDIEPGEEDDF